VCEIEREGVRQQYFSLLLNKSDKGSGQTTRRVANVSTIFSPPLQLISSGVNIIKLLGA